MSKHIFPFKDSTIHHINKGIKKKELIMLLTMTSLIKGIKLKELEKEDMIEKVIKISKKLTERFLDEI